MRRPLTHPEAPFSSALRRADLRVGALHRHRRVRGRNRRRQERTHLRTLARGVRAAQGPGEEGRPAAAQGLHPVRELRRRGGEAGARGIQAGNRRAQGLPGARVTTLPDVPRRTGARSATKPGPAREHGAPPSLEPRRSADERKYLSRASVDSAADAHGSTMVASRGARRLIRRIAYDGFPATSPYSGCGFFRTCATPAVRFVERHTRGEHIAESGARLATAAQAAPANQPRLRSARVAQVRLREEKAVHVRREHGRPRRAVLPGGEPPVSAKPRPAKRDPTDSAPRRRPRIAAAVPSTPGWRRIPPAPPTRSRPSRACARHPGQS